MAFAEDFSVFTDTTGFGVTATIGDTEVEGIFDHEYVEASFNGVPVAGEHPVFSCAESDLPSCTYGTHVSIDGVVYKVRNWQPDGTGWTTLILEKQ
jgi:hypothetical protein